MQNVRHSFQSEKFLHHYVQRVANARKTYLKKKIKFFLGRGFPFFGNFTKKRVF
jgi:hypothetical protein